MFAQILTFSRFPPIIRAMNAANQYREILKNEFESRSSRNSRYSLRAYSRDLGISPTSLSLILSGQQGLSKPQAEKLARQIGFNKEQQRMFIDLVECAHARSSKVRDLARVRLIKHDTSGSSLQLDQFRMISDWYHLAILELTALPIFKSNVTWIAKSLGITREQAEQGVDRLKKLEFLEEVDGVLKQTQDFMATPSGVPSAAIKSFHHQLLKKAEAALDEQSVEERDFSSVIFGMDEKDMDWAKEKMREFRRELMARLENNPKKNNVYCLNMNLFRLSQKERLK